MISLLTVALFSILRRAHGSDFFGLMKDWKHNHTIKRVIISVVLATWCTIIAPPAMWCALLFFPLLLLWLIPGTYISREEWREAMLREFLCASPFVVFYALYCGKPEYCMLALLTPLLGLSYQFFKDTKYQEFLLGAGLGAILSLIATGV